MCHILGHAAHDTCAVNNLSREPPRGACGTRRAPRMFDDGVFQSRSNNQSGGGAPLRDVLGGFSRGPDPFLTFSSRGHTAAFDGDDMFVRTG